jgi:tetratricopeptide (TPR) repeat protein
MPQDPYQTHLNHATALFEAGDVVQAGQIWQAILKREPGHQAAREGLYRVKQALDQKQGAWDNERLLQEGCTLFDLGQVADALHKWERILATDPRHKLAIAYANDARRELGLEPLAAAPGAEPAPAAPAGADQLVREGAQLYDLGMAEEAMAKWQLALEQQPEHQDAQDYLRMARRDQAQAQAPSPEARPAAPDLRETRIWQAGQLLRDRRLEEAAMAFQQLLDQGSQDARVIQGYHQARTLLAAQEEQRRAPIQILTEPAPPKAAAPPPPVGPPMALTLRPPQRDGFRLPGSLGKLRLPRRLQTRRNLIVAGSVLVLAILGLVLYGVRIREAALREAVITAKRNALKPVMRMVEIPSLAEPLDAVRSEAEAALAEDPLLAYFRAQEWQRRDPDNPAATLLQQKAKDKLTYLPVPATLADYDKALQGGDLEGARRCILALLRHDPDDLDLRGRARKVLLALAPIYAGDDRMGKARDALRLGRAMYPQDLTWPARLKLLESLQDMGKTDRAPWIQLLG